MWLLARSEAGKTGAGFENCIVSGEDQQEEGKILVGDRTEKEGCQGTSKTSRCNQELKYLSDLLVQSS